jgi:hypothetical protein
MKLSKKFFFAIVLIAGILFSCQVKAAVPDAIGDLNCVYPGAANSIKLNWSVPSGDPTSYDVRYAQSDVNASNFNNAFRAGQSWPGSAKEGIVVSLTPEKTWFFAIKAVNGSGTSAISNSVHCYVPKVVDNSDKTAPSSSIINLQATSSVLVNEDYIIKGTSSDAGGSFVKQVEVSIDGGNTWQNATLKESTATGFNWEYLWSKPTAGLYLIKTRATDGWGNVEGANTGISVQVLAGESSQAQKSLEEKIIEIQKQIISLLLQLIALLQSQN